MTLHARVRTQLGTLQLDCDLSVEAGVTVAVLGPNGAGKTTLLRVVAGLVPLDEGRVECDGALFEDTTTGTWLTPEARRVGFVFQDHGLFPHLSVLDNVAFGLRARGVDRQSANARAHEWLERVDLAKYATSRPSALSGGQSQRAALARVLVTDPQALLLDEPLAAVDASGRLELRRALRDHLASFTGVRLIVTHDPLEAASLAARVVVLEDGRVSQDGSFGDVSARPRSAWIARMAGLNLLRGAVSDDTILVAINPVERPGIPRSARDILNRLNEVSFNAVLLKELRMIALLRQVADAGNTEGAQWAGMRIHMIKSEMMTDLGSSSKLNAEWAFLCMLRDEGRRAADAFLSEHGEDLGRRSTLDIDRLLQGV